MKGFSAAPVHVFLMLVITLCAGEVRKRPSTAVKAPHCDNGTHTCHQDASCVSTRKSYRCKCKPGFNGDGKVCKDEDECLHGNGGCVHICRNTAGNFTCVCRDGFILAPDGRDCLDKNECFDNKGGCSHQCVNTLGSYECRCSSGYMLDSSGKKCDFGEVCQTKYGCDQNCIAAPTGNGVICRCRSGYTLHSNGKTCIKTCSLGNGGCQHICNSTAEGPVCSCAENYILNPDKKTCKATCSVNNGGCEKKCADSSQGPACSCPEGFRLHQDGRSCIDIDECEKRMGGCSYLCENNKGGFECLCPAGYKVSEDKTCVDIDECLMNSTCDHVCTNSPGSFQCSCQQGFQLHGVTHCADVNECAVRNGGCVHKCTNMEGSYACSCNHGYKLHPNKHDCIDANQCIPLVQQPSSVLNCVYLERQEQQCTITCDRKGQLVNQAGLTNSSSITLQCGPSTSFEWTNLENGRLPQCAENMSAPSYKRKARFVFVQDSCKDNSIDAEVMKQNLTETFNNEKKYRCKNRCKVTTLTLSCGSRRKQLWKLVRQSKKVLVSAEFELHMTSVHHTGQCGIECTAKRTLQRLNRAIKKFKRAIKRQKYIVRFDNKEMKPVKKSFKVDKQTKAMCKEGMQLYNSSCIACTFGTFYSKETQKCKFCARGTYQDTEGQLSCKVCPNRVPGSGVEGATLLSQCSEQCEPGTFSASGLKPCVACQFGTYQPNFGRTSCLPCGGNLKTRGTGSNSFKDCNSKTRCEPGHHYNLTTQLCSKCAKGYYQPQSGQDFCFSCPGKTTTDFDGSVSANDCKDRRCGQHMGDFYGVMESPNYPGNYPINTDCVWKIRPEKDRRILIIIPQIELADGETCGDKIIMRKSKSEKSVNTFAACENRDIPIAFTAQSKKLWIQFTSNGNNTARGFSISFVTYSEEYRNLIEDIVKDTRLYTSKQHQQIFKDRQLLSALIEVIATPYNYLKYANVSHTMFPQSFFKLITAKVRKFFQT